MATSSSILAWAILWTEEPSRYSPWSCKESDKTEATEHAHEHCSLASGRLCDREALVETQGQEKRESRGDSPSLFASSSFSGRSCISWFLS